MPVIVIMGVSESGKSTIGRALANRLQWEFYEGDDYHSPASRLKMQDGQPLTDVDRMPWLNALAELIERLLEREARALLTCSALKRSYRQLLRRPAVEFVYLKVPEVVLRERLEKRHGHFFASELLDSQFATLEEPERALTVDADRPVGEIVAQLADHAEFSMPGSTRRR